MNLIYDSVTLGQNLLVGGLLGLVLAMIGFEPPDDEQNIDNVSMWKIGGNLGWGEDTDEDGKGNGIEIQLSWWLNDLSLLSFPIAYLTAGFATNRDPGLCFNLMMSSLHDTFEGNVLLDFADTVKHFREDYIEFNRMINEPNYEGPKDLMSYATQEAYFYLMKGLNKANPINVLNPIYNMINRDTLIAGEQARNRDFWAVYKHSNNEEMEKWYTENGVTERVSYDEYLRRRYASGNLAYALFNDIFINHFDSKKTGYLWWEMPVRTMNDPLGYAWLGELAMDYDNMCEELGLSQEYYDSLDEEGKAQVKAQYDDRMTEKVLEYIETFGVDNPQAAIKVGFVLPTTTRKAMNNVLYGRMNANWNEFYARCQSGELSNWNEQKEAKNEVYARNARLKNIIYNWVKNENIPTYAQEYEQLITDYDVSYKDKNTNQPVPDWMRFFPNVEATYLPKGNHPTSFGIATVVDTRDRGFNAETINSWHKEGSTGSDLQWIFENIGRTHIKYGRDAGKTANEVIFGRHHDLNGTTSVVPVDENGNLDLDAPTIGWRSYVPKEVKALPDDIKDFTEKDVTATTLGDSSKYNQDVMDAINGKGKVASTTGNGYSSSGGRRYSTYYPRGSYGGGYSSRSGSGNYNPKIYNNPRQVNADRAASMNIKQPYNASTSSYLRPSFSTKGSREAYKRQDI